MANKDHIPDVIKFGYIDFKTDVAKKQHPRLGLEMVSTPTNVSFSSHLGYPTSRSRLSQFCQRLGLEEIALELIASHQ